MAYKLSWFTLISVFVMTSCQSNNVIVEKGQSTNIQCTYSNTVSSVTWQLLNGNAAVNLSTCISVNNSCIDQMSSLYQAHMSSSGSSKVVSLNVTSARTNETRFSCLADNGVMSIVTQLLVYAWPTKPSCSQKLTKNYIEYICTTDNVYPGISARIHRRGVDFSSGDFNYSGCSLGAAGSGTAGDYSATCTWRILWNNMILQTTIFVEMSAYISDEIMINRSAAVSDDITTTIHNNVIVEKGQSTNIQFTLSNTVSSVTWQLLNGNATVNLSTCISVNNACIDQMSSLYQAHMSSSGSSKVVSLNVTSARTNETLFLCLADNGVTSNVTQLRVYAWPTKPSCSQKLTNNYIEYICTTDNVYPGVKAVIHRRGVDFSSDDINYKNVSFGADGSGTAGDFSATCTWRILWNNMIPQTTIFVEMSAYISDKIMINRSAAVSDDKTTNFPVPQVILYQKNCPVGPGVRGQSILIGTNATCKCEIDSSSIMFSLFARWFDKDNTVVGVEDTTDGSSTLTLSYNSSDPKPEYECRPMTPLKTHLTVIVYKPNFTSVPQVILYQKNCPVGPGVRGQSILIGTNATCKCEIDSSSFMFSQFARWFDKDNTVVGVEDTTDGSSTLTLSYNSSDPKPVYECRPMPPLNIHLTVIVYKPNFTSSAPPSIIIGLQPFVIILGAFSYGIVSRFT